MRNVQSSRPARRSHPAAVALSGAVIAALAGCATLTPTGNSDPSGGIKITVMAAENFWGSIATQLGGEHATVTSVINNPNADPHDYEPTTADGRLAASAQYVIVNGIGYDAWAPKLVSANPNPNRIVLTVGDLVGVQKGGNPHQWYSPNSMHKVIDQITADYTKLDPANADYFAQRKQQFESTGLARYNQLVTDIKNKYANTPVAASESVVTPLAQGLGLRLITPESFLDAISEGADPTAKDKATVDEQIRTKQARVYIYNSQNSTPDVQAQVETAKTVGIPVVAVTETPTSANVTFQDWQASQLQRIAQALAQATGR